MFIIVFPAIYASYITATLSIEDGVLYETFYNGKKNVYVRSDGTDYASSVPAPSSLTNDNEEGSKAPLNTARHTDSEAWVCAKKIVEDSLKSPSTAKFCSFTECKVEHLGNGEYMVTGWVEAQNSFGATLRQSFVVTYTATEKGYKNGVAVID